MKPGAQWYLLAVALIAVVPALCAGGLLSLELPNLGRGIGEAVSAIFGGISDARLNNVETFPGSVTWQLDEAGPWNVRVAYDDGQAAPPPIGALACTLRAEGGAPVELVPCLDEMGAYHPSILGRPRRSAEVFLFTIGAPGAYVFEARYPDGAAGPRLDLAASRGHHGDRLDRFWTRRRKAAALYAAAALSFAAGVATAVVVWRRRKRGRPSPHEETLTP